MGTPPRAGAPADLDTRRIVNTHEAKVWRSLVKSFPEHHVMVKIPITRFTNPRANENKVLLYELLSKVYCTFTICGTDGGVIGCVASTHDIEQPALTSAQVQLRAAVERQRQMRAAPPEPGARKRGRADLVTPGGPAESDFTHTGWQQPDSFIAPLESGLAALH